MLVQLDAKKEYQDTKGNWHMPYVQHFWAGVNNWILIPRGLGIPADEYVKMVIEKYHAEVEHNDDYTYFGFYWKKKADMKKYRNDINEMLKTKNINIDLKI